MSQRIEIKKRIFGGYSVSYDCPHCGRGLTSALEEVNLNDSCPDCGRGFIVPGSSHKKQLEEQKRAEERQREKELEFRKKQKAEIQAKLEHDRQAAEERRLRKEALSESENAFSAPATSPPIVSTDSQATQTCPYCAEQILLAAKKCKHCGEFIDKSLEKENLKAQGNDGCSQIIIIAFGIVLAMLLLMLF